MMLAEHPTVRRFHERHAEPSTRPAVLDAMWLRQLCVDCGADDAGLVEIGRAALDDQRADILRYFPAARTLLSFVCRMNRGPIRSPARSASNLEFHATYHHSNEVARRVVAALEGRGVRAMNPSAGFPMEMARFPGKIWVVGHKPVAVAAGLGHMGIHRNVIHPKFGNFIVLGTVLLDAEATAYGEPLDYNPCLECKLCVAACPVGAIAPDGGFLFSSCATHNYREFMSGFSSWVENVADSEDGLDYRRKVTLSETASMWQSLAFGPNYKAAYCLAVCPAGEDVIAPFLTDRARYLEDTVRPLTGKEETIYVIPGSDAEEHVRRRFPRKTVKAVASGMRSTFRRRVPLRAEVALPARQGGEAQRRLPLQVHGQGGEAGDGHDSGRDVGGPGRSSWRGRRARDGRQRDMAGRPGEREEPAVGAVAQAHPHRRFAEAARRLPELLPLIAHWELAARWRAWRTRPSSIHSGTVSSTPRRHGACERRSPRRREDKSPGLISCLFERREVGCDSGGLFHKRRVLELPDRAIRLRAT
jgi:ferredoxin